MPFSVVTAGNEGPAPDPSKVSDAPAGSVLARLREQAASRRREQIHDEPVTGWDNQLVIRYRMPSMDQADRLMAASVRLASPDTGPTPAMSQAAVEIIVTCATHVLGRNQHGELEDLGIGLTGDLLIGLGRPLPQGVDNPADATAAEVIGSLFYDNWIAVTAHAGRVMEWQQGEGPGGGGMGEGNAAT